MCGITGIFHFDKSRNVDYQSLKKMTDIIQHRGPDGEGFFIENNIGLGHRRLSIIDLNTGNQPMFSDDRQKSLVFNGEIYNYIEIRNELMGKGYRFKTSSDTEVVLKAYEEWGIDCQKRFNGMWAFALWDNIKKYLFLSRDRIGEKPLHYTKFDNSFIFGSEIKSLFSYGLPKVIDQSLIEIYLFLAYIPEPFTFYKNIFKLKAGHYLLVKDGEISENTYWDLPDIDENNMLKDKSYIYKEFDSLFNDAVKIRMRSDVPYGAFLSGGLDSSSIVSVMSNMTNFPVNTFTIGSYDKNFDESDLAKEVVDKFKTKHILGFVHREDFNSFIEKVNFHFDEPFGDSAVIPTDLVAKLARKNVKMVLTGDGGDELLSGYNSYAGIKIADVYKNFPFFIQRMIPKAIGSAKFFFSGNIRLKLNRMENVARASMLSFNNLFLNKRAGIGYKMIKGLTSEIPNIYPIEEYLDSVMKECNYKDDFYKLMYIDFKLNLPNGYLVKVDRMSMANSLETRIPFLDHRLIEFMVQVDKNIKLQGWERKSILRNTVGKSLPEDLLKAPKKGFGIPLREWFKDDEFETIIDENLNQLKGLLDNEIIEKIINDNKSGLSDNGDFIWSLMTLNRALI